MLSNLNRKCLNSLGLRNSGRSRTGSDPKMADGPLVPPTRSSLSMSGSNSLPRFSAFFFLRALRDCMNFIVSTSLAARACSTVECPFSVSMMPGT